MGDMFFNSDHASQKLNNTICLYKGIPYYIRTGGGGNGDLVQCTPLDGGKPFNVRYTSVDFDYTHIPLGYITTPWKRALYLAREPQRIVSQGLAPRAVKIYGEGAQGASSADLIMRKEFIDCVLGKHVDYNKAMELLDVEPEGSISIGRHMAVEKKSGKIFFANYRGRPVAVSKDGGKVFTIIDHKASNLLAKRLRNHGVPLA